MGPGLMNQGKDQTYKMTYISHGQRVLTVLCNLLHLPCLAPTQNGTHLFSIMIRLSTAVMTIKQGLCLFNGCGPSLGLYQA